MDQYDQIVDERGSNYCPVSRTSYHGEEEDDFDGDEEYER